MKNGIISLAITFFGIVLVYVLNDLTHELYFEKFIRLNPEGFSRNARLPAVETIIGFGVILGIVSLYFAYKQWSFNKWFAVFAGLMALLLIYLDFLPFWDFQIGDSTLDLGIK